MDNSNFLSYFSGLTETNSKEQIVANANNIISSISLTSSTEVTNEKYKDYSEKEIKVLYKKMHFRE